MEQQQLQGGSTTLNITGSRVKALVEKLTDSEIQEAINDGWAQAAVWCSSPGGGFVYEVFVRAETLDSESLLLKYRFVTGTRDSNA
jgi:phage-related minor tail protein